MKDRPILFNAPMVLAILSGRKTQTRRISKVDPSQCEDIGLFYAENPCPYGQPGDRLYVRETWAQPTTLDPGPTIYRADYPNCVPAEYINVPPADEVVWRPSIHMPKALSRITLEVTGVRVERLLDISEDECRAEGCAGGHESIPGYQYSATPSEHFQHIWKSTGGDWDANPWVWVVEFRRVP